MRAVLVRQQIIIPSENEKMTRDRGRTAFLLCSDAMIYLLYTFFASHILQICEYQNKTEFYWILMILSAIGSSFHTIHTMNMSS